MEYVYGGEGKPIERYKRRVIFEPKTSTVFIDRKGLEKNTWSQIT